MPAQNKFYNASWFYWLILIIVALGLGWFFYGEYYKEGVSWNDLKGSAIQVTTLPSGEKLVRNVEEGYKVIVPGDWKIMNLSDENHKMKIVYDGNQQKEGTELSDGALFNIYCYDNKLNKDLLTWAKERGDRNIETLEVKNRQFYKSTNKVVISDDEVGNPIFLENSTAISYLFNSDGRICDASCTMVGSDYLEYERRCEGTILKSLSINE